MAKQDVGPVTEIVTEVGRLAGEEAKKAFMEGSENIAKATKEEVAQWLKGAMERLDAMAEEETRTRIMEQCGYNCAEMNRSHIEEAMNQRSKFETLDEFLKAEEKKPSKGTRIERKGNVVYQYYTPGSFREGLRCYCSLWRGLPADEIISQTYCHCAKAFVTKIWEAYMGRRPKVELVESCISGAKECKFAVHL